MKALLLLIYLAITSCVFIRIKVISKGVWNGNPTYVNIFVNDVQVLPLTTGNGLNIYSFAPPTGAVTWLAGGGTKDLNFYERMQLCAKLRIIANF